MPVDTTKPPPQRPTRPPRRPPTEEEQKDIDIKRLRGNPLLPRIRPSANILRAPGELSCAECRRLKLKCDKTLPCSSCVRRGCESICPCGVLSAGQGTRFILADTDALHDKIAEMSQRIRQLEEALAILQGAVTSDRHPLLAQDLLRIKFAAEAPKRASEGGEGKGAEPDIDALGTLTLGDDGEVKYFGRSAGTEALLVAEDDSEDDREEDGANPDDTDLADIGDMFPTGGHPDSTKLARLHALLPPREDALSLARSWLLHGALFFRPILEDELTGPFIDSVYARTDSEGDPHTLSALFFILALGALLDLRLPPYNAQSERFYSAGRAALSLRAVCDAPNMNTVRAIGLMATYHSLGGRKFSRDSAWCLMSIAAKISQSIGLRELAVVFLVSERICRRPRLCSLAHGPANGSEKTVGISFAASRKVTLQRTLFWDVFCSDVSNSLALGRPPAIPLSYVDCEYPTDEESTMTDLGEIRPGFWRSKYVFSRDIWMGLAEATLAAKTPVYDKVLELDRKVRELSVPDSFKPYPTRADGETEYHSSSASLRGFYASQYRTVTMLYIHRSFYAQALLDHPENPLRSPFATSFLTAYRSASVLIKATAYQYDRCAEMAMRVWFLLQHAFSAAVIVGTVVTLSPKSSLATSALNDLALAVELFERTAAQSHRAKLATAVLAKLRERAVRAYTTHSVASPSSPLSTGLSQVSSPPQSPVPVSDEAATDELEIFGGQKRVLALKQKQRQKERRSKSITPDGPGLGRAAGLISATPMDLSSFVGEGGCATSAPVPVEFPWLDDLLALHPTPGVPNEMEIEGLPAAGNNEVSSDVFNMLYAQSDIGVLPADLSSALSFSGNGIMSSDLGLTGDSGMDAAWLAFMQQCGVSAAPERDAQVPVGNLAYNAEF
ncbi:hypothetical protein MKEN_00450300 [Mycena kentingensis (nom. inval.)]|nr:hypothetical protein MKEN_00450300 [Mycena kentingensis (nom. inval.)]